MHYEDCIIRYFMIATACPLTSHSSSDWPSRPRCRNGEDRSPHRRIGLAGVEDLDFVRHRRVEAGADQKRR